MKKMIWEIPLNLQLFATAANTTTSSDEGNNLTAEMKTFYSDVLIDNAIPNRCMTSLARNTRSRKTEGKPLSFGNILRCPKQPLH